MWPSLVRVNIGEVTEREPGASVESVTARWPDPAADRRASTRASAARPTPAAEGSDRGIGAGVREPPSRVSRLSAVWEQTATKKKVAESIAGALALVATGCSANDTGGNAHLAGERNVVLLGAAPQGAEPVPMPTVKPAEPGPVPMPTVRPAEPGPVPVPTIQPPQLVPMPRIQPSEPGSTLIPGRQPGGRDLTPWSFSGPTPRSRLPSAR
jgi:hypothetical protein